MSLPDGHTTRSQRRRYRVRGRVQGVGFRPFVYRLARGLGLTGWVRNDVQGVEIEVEGPRESLNRFRDRLPIEAPSAAGISTLEERTITAEGDGAFRIQPSRDARNAQVDIAPDLATCPDCLSDIMRDGDRRKDYPFTNCTHCGPRYTIVDRVPYDRSRTSMKAFGMCPECLREYQDPENRRFHAQPNACPVCGPSIWLCDSEGKRILTDHPVEHALQALGEGAILALRGLGGFHLAADPWVAGTLGRLRERKMRPSKPFALMARNLDAANRIATVDEAAARLLMNPAAPIVLLPARSPGTLPPELAPGLREVGVMLAYTPLHHLLLAGYSDLLVMTSGNLTDEPIAIGNEEAVSRLSGIADLFLLHDREVLQRADDSVCRIRAGQIRVVRRSRGYVPNGISLPVASTEAILAVGGDLKNTCTIVRGAIAYPGQHVGDLEHPDSLRFHGEVRSHLCCVLDVEPTIVVHDSHPGYHSTRLAASVPSRVRMSVQHHHAHLAAVLAENGRAAPAIGIIMDGTGYGPDGTVWGGEILVGDLCDYSRVAHLRQQVLPGANAAIREPWRMAIAYLDDAFPAEAAATLDGRIPAIDAIPEIDRSRLRSMIRAGINCPVTSSCGRLFDAVAALLGTGAICSYEAEAAMRLEAMADPVPPAHHRWDALFARLDADATTNSADDQSRSLDTRPIVQAVVADILEDEPVGATAARFHESVARLLTAAACSTRSQTGLRHVCLGGGSFNNAILTLRLVHLLESHGFDVLLPVELPPGDGGLSFGQAAVATARLAATQSDTSISWEASLCA